MAGMALVGGRGFASSAAAGTLFDSTFGRCRHFGGALTLVPLTLGSAFGIEVDDVVVDFGVVPTEFGSVEPDEAGAAALDEVPEPDAVDDPVGMV